MNSVVFVCTAVNSIFKNELSEMVFVPYGIDIDRGLTHSTLEEIPIKKAAASSAAKVAVLADSTKFGYCALSLIMPISSVHYIITDSPPQDCQQNVLGDKGVQLIWQLPS